MSKTVAKVVKDENGELLLEFEPNVLDELGWKIGDTLVWKEENGGSWSLSKKEETEFVLVEAISMFRQRYVVEVPKGKHDWASDTVVSEQAKEFSQEHLGETISSTRVLSKEELLRLCDQDNSYASSWEEDYKMDVFVTRRQDYE